MNHAVPRTLRILPSPVVQTSEHDKSLASLQLSINNPLVAIRPKIRLLVPPQMTARHNPRRADFPASIAPGHKQTEQHVAVGMVRIYALVPRVVVFVVAVQLLSLRAGPGVHRDGDGEKRVRCVCRRFCVVPICRGDGEKLLGEVLDSVNKMISLKSRTYTYLVQRIREKLLADRLASSN